MKLLTILRDLGIADQLFRNQISPTEARRRLMQQSTDLQQPEPKRIPVEIVKEGAD